VYDPARINAPHVAFENHLNYFHARGAGLPATLAKGLAAYLNSSLVDAYFRQFSGHTQVNAADLRALPYPRRSALIALGRRIATSSPSQEELDRIVQEVLFDG
jgi:adenine-specific DNA-methyltransferase